MGESSSDYERMIRISQLMESKDEINLDEFFDVRLQQKIYHLLYYFKILNCTIPFINKLFSILVI